MSSTTTIAIATRKPNTHLAASAVVRIRFTAPIQRPFTGELCPQVLVRFGRPGAGAAPIAHFVVMPTSVRTEKNTVYRYTGPSVWRPPV